MSTHTKKQKGFSLIELLVVVGIVSMLSSFAISEMSTAREKARDTKRKVELRQIATALQLYHNTYGYYPAHRPSSTCGGGRTDFATSICSEANWLTTDNNFLQFLGTVPKDPVNAWAANEPGGDDTPWWTAHTYTYGVSTDGQDFDLLTNIENERDPERCELKLWVSTAVWPGNNCWSTATLGNVPARAKLIWSFK